MNRKQALNELIEYGLTKAEAEVLIVEAENDDCDFTSSLRNDNLVEFSATATHDNGYTGVVVYYYQDAEKVSKTEDLSNLDWEIDHYETF